MFSEAYVSHSVRGGGGPPWRQTSPLLEAAPPQGLIPSSGHCSSRYASYWKASLCGMFQIKPCLQQAFYFNSHIFLFRRVAEKRKVVTGSATEYFYCKEVLDVSQNFGSADFGDKCLVKVNESHC